MNVTFAVRGNSLAARRSFNGSACGVFGSVTPPVVVTPGSPPAGLIGPSYIDMYQSIASTRYLLFQTGANTPATQAMSVLGRTVFNTLDLQGVWTFGGPQTTASPYRTYIYYNAGNLVVLLSDITAGTVCTFTSAFTPSLGTFYDLLLVDPGTTGAGDVKLYNGTTLLGSGTRSVAQLATPNVLLRGVLSIGGITFDVSGTSQWINEFNIFDYAVDPTAVPLESGTGALGTARTSFCLAPAFDALASSDPGVGNVRLATSYEINGVPKVGTLVIPVSTDPGIANVATGVAYEINNVPLVGTLNSVTNVLQAAVLTGQSLQATLTPTEN